MYVNLYMWLCVGEPSFEIKPNNLKLVACLLGSISNCLDSETQSKKSNWFISSPSLEGDNVMLHQWSLSSFKMCVIMMGLPKVRWRHLFLPLFCSTNVPFLFYFKKWALLFMLLFLNLGFKEFLLHCCLWGKQQHIKESGYSHIYNPIN